MFCLLFFLGIGLFTCSEGSLVKPTETRGESSLVMKGTRDEMGTDDVNLLIRLTSKMESLSVKFDFMASQLQEENRRSRDGEIDVAVVKANEKRIQDDMKELRAAYGKLKEDLSKLQSVVDHSIPQGKGTATFIRWGGTTCPEGSNVIYKGFAAGNSRANNLCLTEEPIYANYTPAVDIWRSNLYGTEYETSFDPAFASFRDKDMPCVVCASQTRHSLVMVPGRNECFPGWTLEYWGYLMGPYKQKSSTDYVCVDTDAEVLPEGEANDRSNMLYLVESLCGSLRCPPYENGWELSCAVCTR